MAGVTALTHRQRVAVLIGLLVPGLAGFLLLEPIPQDPAYHRFADTRMFLGIPNFANVVSNAGFAIVGILGLLTVWRRPALFTTPADARPYAVFFAGLTLVSLGSALFHLAPSNTTLLWDRLPMAIAFMAFTAAVLADRVSRSAGNGWLLALLIAAGLASLLYWYVTELQGRGDLRGYALVQFYPMLMLPVIVWLFAGGGYTSGRAIVWMLACYALSKVLEYHDATVFRLTDGMVSGHTLKHVAAAIAALVVLLMLLGAPSRRRRRT